MFKRIAWFSAGELPQNARKKKIQKVRFELDYFEKIKNVPVASWAQSQSLFKQVFKTLLKSDKEKCLGQGNRVPGARAG